mmetsp:Transcript_9750/g.15728  ORF Transcript_9750/g.15728 Transcript_9750/m.15728 type:complete len:159 (+) Transcript_9750:274-750(+)
MDAAIKIPTALAAIARGAGKPRATEAIVPVHAPVPGKGTPTNSASDIAKDRLSMPVDPRNFLWALASGFSRNLRIAGEFRARMIGITGIKFPREHNVNADNGSTPSNRATGIPPRSSTTGMAEIIMRTSSVGIPRDFSLYTPTPQQVILIIQPAIIVF